LRATEDAIAQEGTIQGIADSINPETRHIWLVGAGTDVVVAKEIALKIKETSYIPAEGMSVEEMLHGPFQCVEPEDLLILIDTQEIATERIAILRAMARVVSVPIVAVCSSSVARDGRSESGIIVTRGGLRAIRAVGALVALQLLSYFMAVARGTDPDSFRLSEPQFRNACALVKL
jgi:glucosamine--fructose-6-phosphate aminotransferase (isomerizing)